MKGTDKYLIAIVVGVLILAASAIVVTIQQPEATYQSESTPGGVAHNYLLAIVNKDYELAYSYLSPQLTNYPEDVFDFIQDLNLSPRFSPQNSSISLEIISENKYGDFVNIEVQETRFSQDSVFGGNQYTYNFEIKLELIDNAWKIVDGNSYFAYCWDSAEICRY